MGGVCLWFAHMLGMSGERESAHHPGYHHHPQHPHHEHPLHPHHQHPHHPHHQHPHHPHHQHPHHPHHQHPHHPHAQHTQHPHTPPPHPPPTPATPPTATAASLDGHMLHAPPTSAAFVVHYQAIANPSAPREVDRHFR